MKFQIGDVRTMLLRNMTSMDKVERKLKSFVLILNMNVKNDKDEV